VLQTLVFAKQEKVAKITDKKPCQNKRFTVFSNFTVFSDIGGLYQRIAPARIALRL